VCAAAGSVVDQLAESYRNQPVVFLEYPYYYPPGDRQSRMFATVPSGTIYFPVVMVDSGQQYRMGQVEFAQEYTSMVEQSLARPAQAALALRCERHGEDLDVWVTLTNHSGVLLSSSNDATVHVIVFEENPLGVNTDTSRRVREAKARRIARCEDGESKRISLTISLEGLPVRWENLWAVVILDYRPDGATGKYDTLQAVAVRTPWLSPLRKPRSREMSTSR